MELLFFVAVIVIAGVLMFAQGQRQPAEQASGQASIFQRPSTEFVVHSRGGIPDHRTFVAHLPRHGDYEFEYVNAYGDFYRFHVMRTAAGYLTFVIVQPSYDGRAVEPHCTHLISGGNGQAPFICHKAGHEPRDLPAAATIAAWWSHCTSRYIRTGQMWS